MTIARGDGRVPILYLAPWVDYGGSDKGTIDWFRWLDRDRFAPILATTQPSENRRLGEIYPFAEEVWPLPDFLAGQDLPPFIFDLIHTRGIQILHVMNSRIGFDLLPDLAALPLPPAVAGGFATRIRGVSAGTVTGPRAMLAPLTVHDSV